MSRDDEQAWADLVESFNATPGTDEPRWPAAEDIGPDDDGASDHGASDHGASDHGAGDRGRVPAGPSPAGSSAAGSSPAGPSPAGPSPAGADEADDHYVPPPPPPFPRGDRVSRLAWTAVLGVPLFLVLAVAADWRLSSWTTALAVGALIAGFVTLLARMRGRDPYDPDDGAVV